MGLFSNNTGQAKHLFLSWLAVSRYFTFLVLCNPNKKETKLLKDNSILNEQENWGKREKFETTTRNNEVYELSHISGA